MENMVLNLLLKYKVLWVVFLTALSYFLGAFLSFKLFHPDGFITASIFLAEGIALALAIYFGPWVSLGVFIGQSAILLFLNQSIAIAVAVGVINALEAFMGWYLSRVFKFYDVDKEGAIWRLYVASALVLQPFSAFVSNLFVSGGSVFFWYIGNLTAQIVLTPLLLRFFYRKDIDILHLFLTLGAIFITYGVSIFFPNMFLLFIFNLILSLLIVYFFGILYANMFVLSLVYIFQVHPEIFLAQSSVLNVVNFDIFLIGLAVISEIFNYFLSKERSFAQKLKNKIEEVKKEIEAKNNYIINQGNHNVMYDTMGLIAHHWRQPLNNLSLSLDLLKFRFEDGSLSAEKFNDIYQKSKKQIMNLSDMIDHFTLLFKKGEKYFFIKESIKNGIDIIYPLLKKSEAYIEVEGEDFKIWGDEAVFLQSILAVLKNSLEAGAKNIKISIRKKGDFLELLIADGLKIDKEIKESMFEPYSSTKGLNGKGLGLYVSKISLQRAFKGDIFLSKDGIVVKLGVLDAKE